MRIFSRIIIIFSLIFSLCSCGNDSGKQKIIIGIIEPLEHTAIDEIVKGFTETVQQQSAKPVTFKIENAQNDANLQRAIIQRMQDAHYTLIVPIGVGTTQMTLAMIHDQPVVSLASSLTEADRKQLSHCNVVAVH